MNLGKIQVYLCLPVLTLITALSVTAEAKKRNKWRAPAEVVRNIRLTTECEKSVVSMLGEDIRLSSVARDSGNAFPMDSVKHKLQILTGETAALKDGSKISERASSEGRKITRSLIFAFLKRLGLDPQIESFGDGANIYAEIQGSVYPDELLEIGAHFDSAGETVPGADDNGSGLALVLQLAEEFVKVNPKRTIRFVFYDLEEKGLLGSRAHARELKKDPRLFLGAIVVDMIGYLPKEAKNFLAVAEIGEEPTAGSNSSDARWRGSLHQLAQAMFFQYARYKDARRLQLSPERSTAKPGTGDHGSYWDAGLPAIFIAAPYEGDYVNPENHSKDDTIANMHWDYYTEVARFVVESAAWISGAQIGPEAADPALNKPNEEILLSAGAALIGPRVDREEELLVSTSSWGDWEPSSPDKKVFDEIEDLLEHFLSSQDEIQMRRLWDAKGEPSVMIANGNLRSAVVMMPGRITWTIRNPKLIEFVASELKINGGLFVDTGSMDPIYMGGSAKDEIRRLVNREYPMGARPGRAVKKSGYTLYTEVPDSILKPQSLTRVRETVQGKVESFKRKHEKAMSRPILDWEEMSWGSWD